VVADSRRDQLEESIKRMSSLLIQLVAHLICTISARMTRCTTPGQLVMSAFSLVRGAQRVAVATAAVIS